MTSADSSLVDKKVLASNMASFIQIATVALLAFWCFRIISPFLHVVIWGLIMSIAVYPAYSSLTSRLGGRGKLSATLIALVGIAVIVIPTWLLAESTIGGLQHLAAGFENGTISVPPPDESVSGWPLIGPQVYELWSHAATNLQETVNDFAPQLRPLGKAALSFVGSSIGTTLQFVLSVIVGAALLTSTASGYQSARQIAASLAGEERGNDLVDLSVITIRSVAKGVLGVAIIQTLLAAMGLLAMDIPAAGLWAGAILVLAIVQLPPLLILGPIAVWVFSVADPVPATIFLIYSIIVSFSDAVLKPVFLGRGVKVPMLVILLGAIGGAITGGILGLFTGSVILALGYELFTAWMAPDEAAEDVAEE